MTKAVQSVTLKKPKRHLGNLLKEKGILKTIFWLALPIFLLFMADTMFIIVDSYLIFKWADPLIWTGSSLEAIKGVLYSYFKLFMSLTLIYVIGTSMFFSYEMGKGKTKEELSNSVNNGILMTAIIAIILYSIGMSTSTVYLNTINSISGAGWTNAMIADARMYFVWYSIATIVLLTRNSFTRILRVEGHINSSSAISLINYPIAILLDFVFIKVLNMGFSGAGLAILIANIISFIAVLIFVHIKEKKLETYITLNWKNFKFSKVAIITILMFGIPSAIWNLCYNSMELTNMVALARISNETGINYTAFFTGYQFGMMIIQTVAIVITTVVAILAGYMLGQSTKSDTKEFLNTAIKILVIAIIVTAIPVIAMHSVFMGLVDVHVTSTTWVLWIIMLMSMSFFYMHGIMSTFLAATKNYKLAIKDSIIKFLLIGITLELVFFFGFYRLSNDNILIYISWMPIWAFSAFWYLWYQYKKVCQKLLT